MTEVNKVLGDKDEVEFDDLGQLQYMGQVRFKLLLFNHQNTCIFQLVTLSFKYCWFVLS